MLLFFLGTVRRRGSPDIDPAAWEAMLEASVAAPSATSEGAAAVPCGVEAHDFHQDAAAEPDAE